MMKLFYSAGGCSTCCHIALEEAGLPHQAVEVDWDKPDANLAEMLKRNPMGAAPVLISDQGKTLTQNAAILEYIADMKPSSHLLPAAGTWERVEAISWLSFVASDLHKAFVPLFALKDTTQSESARVEVRNWAVSNVKQCLAIVDQHLAGKDFLMGKQFTVADTYLFVVVGWCKYVEVKTDEYKNLNSYMARVFERPAVHKVMKMEGLLE